MHKLLLFFTCLTLLLISSASCPPHCICRSRGRVDCSKYNHSFIPPGLPSSTLSLDLHHNDIDMINLDALENCTSLKVLDLTNNLLTNVSPELFTTLSSLESLVLRRNQLTKIPSNLLSAKNLTKIDLRSNRIEFISVIEWTSLSSVKTVDLGRNNLTTLPVFADESPSTVTSSIEELDLTTNGITSLAGGALSKLSSLRILRLPRNHIASIDKEDFTGLSDLKIMDLSRNPLTLLKALTFTETPSLITLNFGRCNLSEMEDGVFFGTTELRELNLSFNQLKTMHEGWLFGLSSLERLDLSSNLITSISNQVWTHVPALKSLNLAKNRFRSLPSGAFHPLRRLESLSLASNSLDALHKTAMAGLDELASLDLSNNHLAAIIEDSALLQGTLPNLTRLNFANNSLRQIPARAFQRFSSLTVLDLRENEVTTIAELAFEPLKLKQLFLNTSSLLCDCSLSWFAPWLVSTAIRRSSIHMHCSYPDPLAELDVIAIDTGNLTCGAISPRPRISHHPPTNQTALVGGEAHFECTARGASPLIIEWSVVEAGRSRPLEEDAATVITANSTMSDDSDSEEIASLLTFHGIKLDDRAEYQCVARNHFGADYSNRSALDVQQVPKLTSEPDDLSLLVGGNAKIDCAATGVPRPTIRWHKDGGESFPAAVEKRLHLRPGEDSIYVMAVRKEDAGVYTCVAGNSAGSVQASATLRVYDNSFRSYTSQLDVNSGETAILDCTCDVQSGQRIEWTKNGERLVADVILPLRIHNSSNDVHDETIKEEKTPRKSLRANDQIFIILEVSSSDGGRYECELMVGSERLARRVIHVVVDGEGGEHTEHEEHPPEALPYTIKFSTRVSDAQVITLLGMTAILILFISIGFVWMLVTFRRSARYLNNYPFREEIPVTVH
ncbi:sma-10 [Pristionchus pacificus]|nr:sma-10 [Pristionchus pacificus]